jgi:phytoene dehydrogenase-like protein
VLKTYDAIVIGGGHNGLVAARYLAAGCLRVIVLEKRHAFGGPAAKVEWMPGYHCSVSNSPGSLEPKIVRDLELEKHGLAFVKPNPTLVHPLTDRRLFVGWREPEAEAQQLDSYAEGESKRYRAMFQYLEDFAAKLGISVFDSPPSLFELTRNLKSQADEEAFSRVFFGSARALFDDFLRSEEAKAVVGPMAVVSGQVSPSTPGTPLNLMIRPLSIASASLDEGYDPRRVPLRGSTGLPIGGMGAIIDAMVASASAAGVELRRDCGVKLIKINGFGVEGVVTDTGEEIDAPVVISAISPHSTILNLIESESEWLEMKEKMRTKSQRGKAYKLVLALDGMPRYAAAKDDDEARALASAQFRIAPTLDYLEESHADMMLGRAPTNPVIWGLCPSMTSPSLAPAGKHVMSMNIGNAPYLLKDGNWQEERDRLAKRCIQTVARWIPNLPDIIADYRCIDPIEFEKNYGLIGANITHGDTLPWNQFWMRPLPGLSNYRTPTAGLYLSGAGTWPGNFVSGIPGHNTAHAVLKDLKAKSISLSKRPVQFQIGG